MSRDLKRSQIFAIIALILKGAIMDKIKFNFKPLIIVAAAALFLLTLMISTSCDQAQKEPPNLTGTWKSINNENPDSWQQGEITESTITIYWITNKGDTKSLYWAGSFIPPTEYCTTYSWDSINDKTQTGKALLAAQSDSKTFKYENNQIIYEATALGTTKTVKLERA